MTFDIICLIMLLIAFAGGFQKGVVRIFTLLIGLSLAAAITLWSVPYLLNFAKASFGDISTTVTSLIMAFEFLIFSWILIRLVNILWKPKSKKKQNVFQNVAGGLMLSAIMLFSIAILSGFFEQTTVINDRIKNESLVYKVLTPIQKQSKKLWTDLTSEVSKIETRVDTSESEEAG